MLVFSLFLYIGFFKYIYIILIRVIDYFNYFLKIEYMELIITGSRESFRFRFREYTVLAIVIYLWGSG